MRTKLVFGVLAIASLLLAPGADAANIMYVENDIDDGAAFGDNGTAQDDAHHLAHWVTWLESGGHTVTLKSAAGLLAAVDAATDMSAFDLIIIGRDFGSGTFNNSKDALAAVTVPILSTQGKPFQGDRSTWWEHSNWDDGDNNNNYTAMVTMPSHAIFNGLAVPGDGIFDFTEFANSDCIEAPFGAGNSATVIATVAQRTGGDATGVGAPYIAYWAAGTPYFTGGLTPMSNRMVLTAGGGVDDPEIPAGLTDLVDEKDGLFDLTRGGAQVFMNAIAFLTTGSVPAGGVSHTYVLPQAVPPGGGDGGGPDYSAPSGASIVWGTPTTVTDENSIDTSGTLIEAFSGGPDAQATQSVTVGGQTIDFLAMDLSRITQGGGTNQADGFIPPGAIDAAFHAVMDTFSYDGPNPKVITLTGLTVGSTYQIQIFISDDRSCCSARTMTVSDPSGNTSAPFSNVDSVSVIGTFTATSDTELVHINGVAQDQTNMNAYVLRRLAGPGGEQVGVASNIYPPYIDEGSLIILTARDGSGYQWSKNGVPIAGATNQTLVFDPIAEEDAATYSVSFNDGTSNVSESIVITVNPEGSVPVVGGLGLAALLGATALAGSSILRRRKK